MKFVDESTIEAHAGKGGDGIATICYYGAAVVILETVQMPYDAGWRHPPVPSKSPEMPATPHLLEGSQSRFVKVAPFFGNRL